jgi:hypothetical protein
MKIAIMQPYFLPYIGYMQLINSVDTFVIYDDVNYIERGWINRNYFLNKDTKCLLTLKLSKASCNKLIKDIDILPIHEQTLFKTLDNLYRHAPYFKEIKTVLNDIQNFEEKQISLFLYNHLQILCNYLGIKTKLILSSTIEKNIQLRGQEKVLNICNSLHATQCINPPGSKLLYNKETFKKNGQEMFFLKAFKPDYKQFKDNVFVNNLSFLDTLMFNSIENVKNFIDLYELE